MSDQTVEKQTIFIEPDSTTLSETSKQTTTSMQPQSMSETNKQTSPETDKQTLENDQTKQSPHTKNTASLETDLTSLETSKHTTSKEVTSEQPQSVEEQKPADKVEQIAGIVQTKQPSQIQQTVSPDMTSPSSEIIRQQPLDQNEGKIPFLQTSNPDDTYQFEPENDKEIRNSFSGIDNNNEMKTSSTILIPILMTNKQGIEVKPKPGSENQGFNLHSRLPFPQFPFEEEVSEHDKSENEKSEHEKSDKMDERLDKDENIFFGHNEDFSLENDLVSISKSNTEPDLENLDSQPKVLGAGFGNLFSNTKVRREKVVPEINSGQSDDPSESDPVGNQLEPLTNFIQNKESRNFGVSMLNNSSSYFPLFVNTLVIVIFKMIVGLIRSN